MRRRQDNSHSASTLSVVLSIGLISICAGLFVIAAPANVEKAPPQDSSASQLREDIDSITALGNYPDTSVPLSGNRTVIPDAAPANTTSINVSTNTNFNGTFAASPTTGVVTITDAHPVGTYTVTVTAFGPGGTTTKTFTLTVASTVPCGSNFSAGFTNAADVSANSNPQEVAIGDFNGDGKQDLAIANFSSSVVSIRLGDGLGGFTGSTNVSVGSNPKSVAIGDFNNDGNQDFATASYGSPTVSIRLGNGLGGFTGSTEVSVGANPYSVAVGDFNGDGKQDLAVANSGSNTVSIRLGDGMAGFSGSTSISVGNTPTSIAIGDFNGDGRQDLAVVNTFSNTVSIRLGDGLGNFSGSTNVIMGSRPFAVAIGDFNGDGNQDLVTADYATTSVSIRLGNGSGGFSGSTTVSVGTSPISVAIGDFNGDGNQDLAVTNYDSANVSIRLGDGLGGFSGSSNFTVGSQPVSVAIGNFNGDDRQDLAAANDTSGTVSIRLGQCIALPTPTATATGTPPPTPTATATVTATPTATATVCGPVTVFSENFDGVTAPALPPGWVSSFSVGPANCTPTGTCSLGTNWATTTISPDSTPNCAFHDAPGCVTNSNLDTPSFVGGTFSTQLFFRHSFDLESGFDGAVLEISINGGPFTDIITAGGQFFEPGAYNGTISSGSFSPIAGRAAWTGNSAGYISTTIQMPGSFQNIRLRFRLATDCMGAGTGWRIDTIRITYPGGCPTATATATARLTATPTATLAPTATATATAPATATPTATATANPTPTPTPCPIFNISGTVGQCTTAGPSGVPRAGVTITRTISGGGGEGSTTTDENGNYFFPAFGCATNIFTPSKPARLPGSAGINTTDVVAVQRHFLAISLLTGCRLAAADCASPAGISTADVIAIQRFYLGLTTGIGTVGRYNFTPASRSYSLLFSDQTAQNYDTIVFGDTATPFANP